MVKPGRSYAKGRVVHVAPGVEVHIVEETDRGTRIVQLVADTDDARLLERHGHIPLPPYITRKDAPDDSTRYQTVYAREAGSVAAPTAGLHFTETSSPSSPRAVCSWPISSCTWAPGRSSLSRSKT